MLADAARAACTGRSYSIHVQCRRSVPSEVTGLLNTTPSREKQRQFGERDGTWVPPERSVRIRDGPDSNATLRRKSFLSKYWDIAHLSEFFDPTITEEGMPYCTILMFRPHTVLSMTVARAAL